jgi:hypothetical protein
MIFIVFSAKCFQGIFEKYDRSYAFNYIVSYIRSPQLVWTTPLDLKKTHSAFTGQAWSPWNSIYSSSIGVKSVHQCWAQDSTSFCKRGAHQLWWEFLEADPRDVCADSNRQGLVNSYGGSNTPTKQWNSWHSKRWTCALVEEFDDKFPNLGVAHLLIDDREISNYHTYDVSLLITPEAHGNFDVNTHQTVTELVFSYYLDFHLFKNLFLWIYISVFICTIHCSCPCHFLNYFDHLSLKCVGDLLDKTQSGIKVSRSVSKYNIPLYKTYKSLSVNRSYSIDS